MKRSAVFLLLLILALQACGGGTATPTEEPTLEAASTPTESPTIDATEPPTEAVLVPVDLAGPPMEVGSKYVFVDGTPQIVCNDVSLSISSECGIDNVPFSVVSFQLNQPPLMTGLLMCPAVKT